MLLRFTITAKELLDATEDSMDCYSNLDFREVGGVTIVSGSARDMLPFLEDISNNLPLDSVIQDPVIQ